MQLSFSSGINEYVSSGIFLEMGIKETGNITFLGWERKPENYIRPSNKVFHMADMPGISVSVLPEEKKAETVHEQKSKKPKKEYITRQVEPPDKDFADRASTIFEKMIIGFKDKKTNIEKSWVNHFQYDNEIDPYLTKSESNLLKFILYRTVPQKKGFEVIPTKEFLQGWKHGTRYKLNAPKISESNFYNALPRLKELGLIFVHKFTNTEKLYILNTRKGRDIYNKLESGEYNFQTIQDFDQDIRKSKKSSIFFNLITKKELEDSYKFFYCLFKLMLEKSGDFSSNQITKIGGQSTKIVDTSPKVGDDTPKIRDPKNRETIVKSDSSELSTETYINDIYINETSTNKLNQNELKENINIDKSVVDVNFKISENKNKANIGMSGDNILANPKETESQNEPDKAIKKSSGAGGQVSDEPEVTKPDTDNSEENVYKLKIKSLTDLACSVKYKDKKLHLTRKRVLEIINERIQYDGITNTETVIRNQAEWFTFRDIDLEKWTAESVFINCLKDNRPAPENYKQEVKKIESDKDLEIYLPLVEAWNGAANNIKNGPDAKNDLIRSIGRAITAIKDAIGMTPLLKRKGYVPDEAAISLSIDLKKKLAQKIINISQVTNFDFFKFIENFDNDAKNICHDALNIIGDKL